MRCVGIMSPVLSYGGNYPKINNVADDPVPCFLRPNGAKTGNAVLWFPEGAFVF